MNKLTPQDKEMTNEEQINQLALEMLAVLAKVIHAIQHSNMKGTILHQEITAVVKKAMCSPLKITHGDKRNIAPYKKTKTQNNE
jgi:hypothetical protein